MAGGQQGRQTQGGAQGQIPPWLQGLQIGQQIAQSGQPQRPQAGPMMMQRPGMGAPPGMPQGGVVPGAQGMAPTLQSGPPQMATGGQGMMPNGQPQGGQQQMTPQMLQMLMQQRGLMR
jgi:hypothetical protein